jgi:hypothetical protein
MRNPSNLGAAVVLALIAAVPAALRAIESGGQQPAQGAAASAALPAAADLMDGHIKAIGGRDALLSRSSLHAVGKVEMPSAGVTGTLEMFAAKPNKTLLKMSLPGIGDFHEGFDGTVGWSMNPLTGPTLMQGAQLEQRKMDSDFYSVVNYEKRYESMTTVEITEFDGRPCYKVRLVRRGGPEDFQFYDVKTGLRAGMITTRETPMGSMTATMTETDYKPFGGVLQPTRLNTKVENLQQVMTFEKFEFDKVDPSVFELPDQIRALAK